jgi:hypothetical protein
MTEGGPGGWIFLLEVEIMFGEDLLVADWSGLRKASFPGWPENNGFSKAPDWICEILSRSTVGNDKVRAEPFNEVEFDLGSFWTEESRDSSPDPGAGQ